MPYVHTSVSRDGALKDAVDAAPGYPGPSSLLDAADRAWLEAAGLPVPPAPDRVPLHEAARLARKGAKKKKTRGEK